MLFDRRAEQWRQSQPMTDNQTSAAAVAFLRVAVALSGALGGPQAEALRAAALRSLPQSGRSLALKADSRVAVALFWYGHR